MQFIYPEFLLALFALAIPVLIHLFNFRRFKKLYFTNVRFLREIKQDTRSRSKLKHLLVLLARLLALACLVLAFAQPYFPSALQGKAEASRKVSIYVDNSFSMDAQGKNGALLDEAKQKAREVALAYKVSDRFQLLTNDFQAKHQRFLNRDEFLEELSDIKPGSSVRNLHEVVSRQSDILLKDNNEKESSPTSYIISDFQKSISNVEDIHADSLLNIRLIPLKSTGLQNVSIDTAYLSTPLLQVNSAAEMIVRLKNSGTKNVENVPLKLTINNVQKALGSVNIASNSMTEVKLSFTPTDNGWQSAKLNITDYPVIFDDDYFLSFNIRPNILVLSINGNQGDKFLQNLYGNDPYFQYKAVPSSQVDYSSFSSQQLIILNEVDKISSGLEQELTRYVKRGGVLFIIPSASADLESYQSIFQGLKTNSFISLNAVPEKISKIESSHPLFEGVFEQGKRLPENMDLPAVQQYFQLGKNSRIPEIALMKFQNGSTFLGMTESGNGQVFTLSVPLQESFSSFQRHAIFVPIMLKAALQSGSRIQAPSIIGRENEFTVQQDTLISNDQVVHLRNEEIKFDIIPDSKMIASTWLLSVRDQVQQAGNYSLYEGNRLITIHSFNYDRKESNLDCYTGSELEELVSKSGNPKMAMLEIEAGQLTHTLTQLEEGIRLWKYFIILALVFLAIEILLLRYFQPAGIKPQAI